MPAEQSMGHKGFGRFWTMLYLADGVLDGKRGGRDDSAHTAGRIPGDVRPRMTDTPDAVIVSDKYWPVITAQRRHDGSVVIGRGARFIALSNNEIRRPADFAENRPHIQRYPLGG